MQVDASGSHATVTGAIRQAAQLTGTNFQYLLATAQIESNLNPNATGSASSARGLFQFIDQTWLATLKQHGAALGYGSYADSIVRLPSGRYAVTDRSMARPIMGLRSDPTANAMMAGAFTRTNAAALTERLGRQPTEGELYIAHFLGPGGAARLIGMAEQRSGVSAAQIFPGAARVNRSIFYDRQGSPRSVGAVYRTLVGRYDVARATPARPAMPSATQMADALNAASPAASVGVPGAIAPVTTSLFATVPVRPAQLASAPAVAGPLLAHASQQVPQPEVDLQASQPELNSPVRSLFSTGPRKEPLAPWVTALWSTPSQATETGPAVARSESGGTLDLFQDQRPDVGALFRGRG